MRASSIESGAAITRPDRFIRIEGLRAIAAISVFFTHVGSTRYITGFEVVGFDNTVRAVLDSLTIGVKIFFGISGFVLLRPFIRRHVEGVPAIRGSGYIARRALRIFPAYWIALLGTTFVIRGVVYLHGAWPWFANLTLIQGYSRQARYNPEFVGMIQAWTLVVEITFYCFLALYASTLRRIAGKAPALSAQAAGLAALSVLTIGAYLWSHLAHAPDWIYVLPEQMPLFLCGMLVAVVTSNDNAGLVLRSFQKLGQHPAQCCAIAALAFAAIPAMSLDGPPPWFATLVLHMLIVILLLCVAVLPASQACRTHRILENRVVLFLGTISYGIYLWHYAIVYWISNNLFAAQQGQTMLKVTLVALPASIAVAWVSYRLIERPAMTFARNITKRH